MVKIVSRSVEETIALGQQLAHYLKVGDLVALCGIFGSGKTYFTKGLSRGLGIQAWRQVTSPSFVLCNIYQGTRCKLYHFDCQRMPDPTELIRLGLSESLLDGISVIEWADKFPELDRHAEVIKVNFTLKGQTQRLLSFSGHFQKIKNFFASLKKGGAKYAEKSAGIIKTPHRS